MCSLGSLGQWPGWNWTPTPTPTPMPRPMPIPGQELLLRLPAVLGTAGVVTGHVKTQEIETTTRATALFVPLCVCVCVLLYVCVCCRASNKFTVCRQQQQQKRLIKSSGSIENWLEMANKRGVCICRQLKVARNS